MSHSTVAHVPKAVLCARSRPCPGRSPHITALTDSVHVDHYTPGSVWSAVPTLTALEKGFTEVQLEKRLVNLSECGARCLWVGTG